MSAKTLLEILMVTTKVKGLVFVVNIECNEDSVIVDCNDVKKTRYEDFLVFIVTV